MTMEGQKTDNAPMSTVVTKQFIWNYYTILNEKPDELYKFYGKDSSHSFGDGEVYPQVSTGQDVIRGRIADLKFVDAKVRLTAVDSQETTEKNILIVATGTLSNQRTSERRFVQTFVLAPQQPAGYYVRNDLLRYLEDSHGHAVVASEEVLSATESVVTAAHKQPGKHGGGGNKSGGQQKGSANVASAAAAPTSTAAVISAPAAESAPATVSASAGGAPGGGSSGGGGGGGKKSWNNQGSGGGDDRRSHSVAVDAADGGNKSDVNYDAHVYVRGLDYKATEDDVRHEFSKFGEVLAVEMRQSKKGTAYIEFATVASAKNLIGKKGIKVLTREVVIDVRRAQNTGNNGTNNGSQGGAGGGNSGNGGQSGGKNSGGRDGQKDQRRGGNGGHPAAGSNAAGSNAAGSTAAGSTAAGSSSIPVTVNVATSSSDPNAGFTATGANRKGNRRPNNGENRSGPNGANTTDSAKGATGSGDNNNFQKQARGGRSGGGGSQGGNGNRPAGNNQGGRGSGRGARPEGNGGAVANASAVEKKV